MTSPSFSSKWFFRICSGILFFVAAAASFTGFYQRWPFFTPGDSASSFESEEEVSMLMGTASRPYVYRQLLPDSANFLARVTPQSLQGLLFRRIYPIDTAKESVKFAVLGQLPPHMRQAWFYRFLILYLLTFFSALAAIIAMYLVCDALALPTPVSVLSSVLIILLAPYAYIFPYDYSELALMAVAAYIALRFEWWWLLPVATLGAWNKESFLFFIPMLFPFLRQRTSAIKAATAVVSLCLICGLVYLRMRARFAHNPGSTVIVQFSDHFSTFLSPFSLFRITDEVYGLRLPRVSTLIPTLFLLWTFVRVWKRLPAIVRQHGFLAIAINAPLYLLFCTPGEYRDLSLLSILFLLVIAWNVKEWLERPIESRVTADSLEGSR